MKFVLTPLIFVVILGCSRGDTSDVDVNLELVRAIENSMRVKDNPCSEFHYYACGEWSDPDEYSTRTKLTTDVNNELFNFMDTTQMTDMPEFVKKSHEFYSSCIDTESLHEINYIRWLEEHENMKSVLLSPSEDNDADFDWVHTLGIMRRYGMNDVFIQERMKGKNSDPSKMIIDLKKPEGDDMYRMSEFMFEVLNKSIELPSGKQITEFWNEISAFEDLLEKLYELKDELGEHLFTVKELPQPWLKKYLGIILQLSPLDANMEISLQNVPYIEALDALLNRYDDIFICRYLEVRFLWYIFQEVLPQSHSQCMIVTNRIFPIAMHWVYEQIHPELKQEIPKIEQMFGNIIDHINRTLRSDNAGLVSENMLKKLDNMQIKVGNLPRVDTIQVLNSHYDPLKLDKSDVYGNYLTLLEFNLYIDHKKIVKDLNIHNNEYFDAAEYFHSYAKVLRSYNLPAENIVVLPVELLRPPFYNIGYNDIFKYATIGSMLAHSIYDNLEFDGLSKSDAEKLVDTISWSTSADIVFSSFPVELNEKHYTIHGKQMSMKKLFFLSAAQPFCASLPSSEIHEPLARIPEFAEAFGCKINAYFRLFGL